MSELETLIKIYTSNNSEHLSQKDTFMFEILMNLAKRVDNLGG